MSNSSSYKSLNDNFGPALPKGFDFTILFEDSILSILPSVLLLIVLPLRLIALYGKPRKVSRSILYENKLLFLAAFACMQTVILVLSITKPVLRSRATLAASVLAVIDAIGLCWLSHREHLHSIRPSAIINIYLLITLPFDIARTRTLWLDGSTKSVAAVFSSTVGIKWMILIVEAIEKRGILLERYQGKSPEATSGIYSRSFFFWLNSLMTSGFQRVLNNEDLYPIDDEMSSEVLHNSAQQTWNKCNKDRSLALFWATLKANRWAMCYCIFPRICLTAFRYAQPFLISRTVNFANSPEEPDSIGWGLTAAFGLVFLGLAISNGAYYHMAYRFVTSVRGSLVTLVYFKTMDLSITELDESIAMTLMSNDTEAICEGVVTIHEMWAVPLELALALWILNKQIGVAFVAPASVAILSMVAILAISKYMANAQKVWIRGIQTRVDFTASMLSSMKSGKMLGFTPILTKTIQNLRIFEIGLSNHFRKLLCYRVFLGNSTAAVAPFATFAIFVIIASSSGRELNTASAYTALSLISLIGAPMNTLCQALPALIAALACFTRVENFLKSDARQDHRLQASTGLELDNAPLVSQRNGDIQMGLIQSSRTSTESTSDLISAQDVSFGWTKDGPSTVHDLSFALQRHKFSFLIGPIGSGKSTVLKGLLGETSSVKGFVYSTNPTTAFVDQSPWIRNGSIRQNILGISALDEPWYNQVVHACALEGDISILPKGHETPVGSAGISLSGGQKQRLALARAVYARKSLIILDDVFSGLDAGTEEHIFNLLLGKSGLFRKMGTTVLLATHAVQRLSYSDHIIALDSSGTIAEQGTFEELRGANGYVQSLAAKLKSEGTSQPSKHSNTPPFKAPLKSAEVEEIALISDELNRQSGDLSVYKHWFASIGLWPTLIFFFLEILFGVPSKMTEYLLTYWTAAVERHGNSVNGFYLGLYGMLAVLAMIGLIGAVGQLAMVMIPKSAEKLHAQLLQTVMNAPLSFFTTTDTGVTTNRFSQDMTIIDTELPYAFVDFCFSTITALMGAILMCLSAGFFAATMPPVILLVWVLQKFYLRTSRQMRLLDLEAKSPLYSHFIESLSGLVTIRAFGWGDNFRERNLTLLDASQKPYYLLFCIQRWLALVLDLLVTVLAVILMVLVVQLRDKISPGFVGLALLNVMSFNSSLAQIIKCWTNLETALGAISRLISFSATTKTENAAEESNSVVESWPEHGSIEFKNVSASYSSSPSEEDLVIRNLSISILPGEKIGICGRSGSGKSSLITTLFRMLEVTPGSEILIDGISILTLPRELIRRKLNAIPQEPFFIRGSIRLNADPYSLHIDDQIITAIKRVKLWDLVQAKGGLDADLDTEFFSHGQRQLFCLARAILRKSKVVVLDEVTSSVDAKSDELMQGVLRAEFKDATILAVAHRLDTLLDFDRVVVLGEGEIREMGNPKELLDSRKGLFWDLWNS